MDSCTLRVELAPTSAGSMAGEVVFTANTAQRPYCIPVTASGVQAAFLSEQQTVSFGAVGQGSHCDLDVAIRNSGTAAMTVRSISSGSSQYVLLSESCRQGLVQPGQGCTASVRFHPIELGAQSAQLTFADDAPGSPHTVTLIGRGVGPGFAATPDPLELGLISIDTDDDLRPVTITNTGETNLVITDTRVVGADASDFAVEVNGRDHDPVPTRPWPELRGPDLGTDRVRRCQDGFA